MEVYEMTNTESRNIKEIEVGLKNIEKHLKARSLDVTLSFKYISRDAHQDLVINVSMNNRSVQVKIPHRLLDGVVHFYERDSIKKEHQNSMKISDELIGCILRQIPDQNLK